MKRNWNLIRDILIELEELYPSLDSTGDSEEFIKFVSEKSMPNYNPSDVSSHIKLLIEAGLIEGHCRNMATLYLSDYSQKQPVNYRCYGLCLTWAGYEFLDTIRDAQVWNKTVKAIKTGTKLFTVEAIKQIATSIIGGV